MEFNISAGSFPTERKFEPLDAKKIYDVLILGGGPAGLTAAVYCMRKGVSAGMIVKEMGGQVAETTGIENYPGFRYIGGLELTDKFKEQVLQFGIGFEEGTGVASIQQGKVKKVALEDGRVFSSRAVIITTGKSWKKLNVPGEKEFSGRGVAYCSTCDAPFFEGKTVIVVGGGNSGLESAIDLAKIARKVILVQFLETLTGDKILADRLMEYRNVEILYENEVVRIMGEKSVESVTLRDRKSGREKEIQAQGIFIEIGLVPNTGFVKDILELNQTGEIIVDCACNTSSEGIFAAGDVTSVPFKQIINAGGEGAKAALSACEYILKN
jgi:NADH-dependent peroxiredoxin subunit F